jgi:DIRAS family, GTP-binding Ras-like 2
MQRLSITKGHAFILVYSVCSRQSLEEIRPIWHLIKEIKSENLSSIPVMLGKHEINEKNKNINDEILIQYSVMLYFSFLLLSLLFANIVGNKIDEPAELREVSSAEGQAQAAEWGVHFMETSAKTNHNVTELFEVHL